MDAVTSANNSDVRGVSQTPGHILQITPVEVVEVHVFPVPCRDEVFVQFPVRMVSVRAECVLPEFICKKSAGGDEWWPWQLDRWNCSPAPPQLLRCHRVSLRLPVFVQLTLSGRCSLCCWCSSWVELTSSENTINTSWLQHSYWCINQSVQSDWLDWLNNKNRCCVMSYRWVLVSLLIFRSEAQLVWTRSKCESHDWQLIHWLGGSGDVIRSVRLRAVKIAPKWRLNILLWKKHTSLNHVNIYICALCQ